MSASADIGFGLGDVQDYAQTALKYARMAVWAKRPRDQVAANLVIIVAAMLSSLVSFGATLVIAALATPFLLVGLGRLAIRAAAEGGLSTTIAVALASGVAAVFITVALASSPTLAVGVGVGVVALVGAGGMVLQE